MNVNTENIVAFTFTKKATEELKSRFYEMGEIALGNTHSFANMYIGTIHGFCLKMLLEFLLEFQSLSVLDEIHPKLFIERYYDDVRMADYILSGLGLIFIKNYFYNRIRHYILNSF